LVKGVVAFLAEVVSTVGTDDDVIHNNIADDDHDQQQSSFLAVYDIPYIYQDDWHN
jgi:hypothetical protein